MTPPTTIDRRTFLRQGSLALGVFAVPGLPRALLLGQDGPLDFQAAGRALFTRWGVDAGGGSDAYYELIAKACITLQFGPALLHVPKEAFRADDARRPGYPDAIPVLRLAVPAVLRGLSRMAAWARVESVAPLDDKELETLAKELVLPADYDPTGVDQPVPLRAFAGDKPKGKLLAALDKIDALCACPLFAEGGSAAGSPVPLLVLPTRRGMVEFACAAGVAEPPLAGAFHIDAVTGWVHSYYGSPAQQGRVHLLCLEEGVTGDGAMKLWQTANGQVEPAMIEHSLTYDTLVGLLSNWNTKVSNWFALGLGFVGVMECYGGLAGRVGADSVADVTPPRSAFVPGGNSNGGAFVPNASDLRSVLKERDLLRLLEARKRAAYDLLQDRDTSDPQRKAAKSGDEEVFFNLRGPNESEEDGYLHFGGYVGNDVSHLATLGVGDDLARVQRAVFTLVAAELVKEDKGKALARLLAVSDPAADFEAAFAEHTGTTPAALERRVFDGIKKK